MSRSQTTQTRPGGTPGQPTAAGPVAPPKVLRSRRRRPGVIALSVALIASGGLCGAVLFTTTGQRTDVVTVAREVPVGSVITEQDLGEASISLDPGLKTVKVEDRGGIVGKRAAVDLKPGSLLARNQITDKALVGPGEQLVGVSVKPSQVPATALAPGQQVQIVSTPGQGEEPGTKLPEAIEATVVVVGKPTQAAGVVTVDVAVAATDGPSLAARAATGNVAIVVQPREGS